LEIIEPLPSPVIRTTGFSNHRLVLRSPRWGYLGRIEIVASAIGKKIPTGYTKIIQPFETGIVRAIHVSDGQAVKEGDDLIEFDPTTNEAETSRLKSDLICAQLDVVAQLRAALADGDALANFVSGWRQQTVIRRAEREFRDPTHGGTEYVQEGI